MGPRPPKYVVLVGYELSRKDFEEFVMTTSALRAYVAKVYEDHDRNVAHCVSAYNAWAYHNRTLKPPVLELMYHDIGPVRNMAYAGATECFFPVRYVRYSRKDQLQRAIAAAAETEADRAKIMAFISTVEGEQDRGTLDTSKLSFKWYRLETEVSLAVKYGKRIQED